MLQRKQQNIIFKAIQVTSYVPRCTTKTFHVKRQSGNANLKTTLIALKCVKMFCDEYTNM